MGITSGKIAYLGLGSNLDDPLNQIEGAIKTIAGLPQTTLLRRSSLYVSKPWGKLDQPDFLNCVVEIKTSLMPHTLLRHCKHIEAEQGRIVGEHWGPRQVDVDILIYDERVLRTASLVIPHPRMWERAFVLRPLSELRPDLLAPSGESVVNYLRHGDIANQGIWPYEPTRKPEEHAE